MFGEQGHTCYLFGVLEDPIFMIDVLRFEKRIDIITS